MEAERKRRRDILEAKVKESMSAAGAAYADAEEAKEQATAKKEDVSSTKKEAAEKAAKVQKLKKEIELKKQEIVALTQQARESKEDAERLLREAEVKGEAAVRAQALAVEKEKLFSAAKAKGDEDAAALAEFDKRYGMGPKGGAAPDGGSEARVFRGPNRRAQAENWEIFQAENLDMARDSQMARWEIHHGCQQLRQLRRWP